MTSDLIAAISNLPTIGVLITSGVVCVYMAGFCTALMWTARDSRRARTEIRTACISLHKGRF